MESSTQKELVEGDKNRKNLEVPRGSLGRGLSDLLYTRQPRLRIQQAFRNVCGCPEKNPSFYHSLIEHLLCTRLQAAFRKDTQHMNCIWERGGSGEQGCVLSGCIHVSLNA